MTVPAAEAIDMTFCPFATLELVGPHSMTSIVGKSIGLVLHVNASDGDPFSTFQQGSANSHWQVMKTGKLIQYVDSDLDSWAQMAGNTSYHSVESEGYPTESLTAEQITTIAKLYAWGHNQYGWPLVVSEVAGTPGFCWHGAGGVAWGNHEGCPGDLRKAQRSDILTAAAAILAPNTPTPTVGQPFGETTMQAVPFSCTTDASGHYEIGIPLPAGCSKVVAGSLDLLSIYAGKGWDTVATANPEVGGKEAAGLVVTGLPNHFYTGHAICA